jgi:hypothetical protein
VRLVSSLTRDAFGDTPSFRAQKGNFLGPAAKEGIAILFADTSPRGAGIEGEDDDWDFGTGNSPRSVIHPQLISTLLSFTGAGFYLDATNPKYALHYNMRTHIQFEIPQVLEIADLPIVNSDICFSPLELNGTCRISHACLYLAIAWVAMGRCVRTSRQKQNSTALFRPLHPYQIPSTHPGDRKHSQDTSKVASTKRRNNMTQPS